MPNSQLKVKGILVIAEKIRKNAVGLIKGCTCMYSHTQCLQAPWAID